MLVSGTVLHGRYQIERLIEEGGMSLVYAAWDKSLGAHVAIKEMKGAFTDNAEKARVTEQFRLEATMLANLVHHGLPRVTNSFDSGSTSYLVMDLIDGDSLTKMLNRYGKTPPEPLVWMWMYEICEVLEYLHTRKPPIIFRDLKPSNIMVTREGHVRVIDFGISKVFDTATDGATRTAIRGAGTGYQPPEQYGKNSARRTDPRSDLYSLGATIYSVLTFQVPAEATDRFMNQVPLVPAAELCDISSGMDAMIEKLMRLDPEQRYASARDVMKELTGWMGGPPPRDAVDLPPGMAKPPPDDAPPLHAAPPTRVDSGKVQAGVATEVPTVPPAAPVIDPALHHQPTVLAPPSLPEPMTRPPKPAVPMGAIAAVAGLVALLGAGMWYGTHLPPGPTSSPTPSPSVAVVTPSVVPASPTPSPTPKGFRIVVHPDGTEVTINRGAVNPHGTIDGFEVPITDFDKPVQVSLRKTGYVPVEVEIRTMPVGPKVYTMVPTGKLKFTGTHGHMTFKTHKQYLAGFGISVPVETREAVVPGLIENLPPGPYEGDISADGYEPLHFTATVKGGAVETVAGTLKLKPVPTFVPRPTYQTIHPHVSVPPQPPPVTPECK